MEHVDCCSFLLAGLIAAFYQVKLFLGNLNRVLEIATLVIISSLFELIFDDALAPLALQRGDHYIEESSQGDTYHRRRRMLLAAHHPPDLANVSLLLGRPSSEIT